MPTYVYDPKLGCSVDKKTGKPIELPDGPLCAPAVYGDLPGYQSPIDGSWIEGRRARKYDMEKNNCVDANDFSAPKKLKNKRFIEKHGLQHLSEQ